MQTSILRTFGTGRAICFVASCLAVNSTIASTPENSWTNTGSGAWDNASSWSLGVLPDSSQSIFITNSNWKAVGINPSTPVNSPGSMTVSSLTIVGATNTENTLLLNYFGTAVPLTVLNGITLQDDGRILDLNSGLVVEGGTIVVTNSQIGQDGGFVNITNAKMDLENGEYDLTNGIFYGGQVTFGSAAPAGFNQYGGTAVITNLVFGRNPVGGGGNYALYGGNLSLPNGLILTGTSQIPSSSYFQSDGTNQTPTVFIEPGIFGIRPSFTLNGGLLADNNASIIADDFDTATITQNGGTHVITNELTIAGGAADLEDPFPATYQLKGGALSASSVTMDATVGPAAFNQTNGTAQFGEFHAHTGSIDESPFTTSMGLSGGALSCANFFVTGGGDISQSGGALVVSNTLSIDGFYAPGPIIYTSYQLTAGTLAASNIIVGGIWTISDSAGTISNPGTCALSRKLQIGNAPEQLGRFVLANTAVIDLAGSASQLSFVNSSGETWTNGAMLEITDWNGNASGGGAEQLKFGTDQSGLTSAQVNQIRFHIATNLYSAKILSTGEVVPDQIVAPPLTFVKQGNNFIVNWLPVGYSLQTSTNVSGPYSTILDRMLSPIAPPYTNDITTARQRFFRLAP